MDWVKSHNGYQVTKLIDCHFKIFVPIKHFNFAGPVNFAVYRIYEMPWSCCSYLAAETLPWAPCSPPAPPCAWTAAPPPSVSSSSASWSLLSSCLRLWRAAGTSPGPDQRGTWQQSHSDPGNVHIICKFFATIIVPLQKTRSRILHLLLCLHSRQ